MTSQRDKVGLWMIGACGGIGATVALGLAFHRKRGRATTGLVTEHPALRGVPLTHFKDVTVGGHEVRSESLIKAARNLSARSGLFDEKLIHVVTPQLRAWQRNIRVGTIHGAGRAVRAMTDRRIPKENNRPSSVIERLSADIDAFRRRNGLDRVVVVNVASSEPPVSDRLRGLSDRRLQQMLSRGGSTEFPPSLLYALAAIHSGCALINFTASSAMLIPAVRERADQNGVPYMGNDGKTGETLVKSALAPMFAMRNLRVLSWVGQNVLGNRDGAVLQDLKTRAGKIRSKDKVVSAIVGSKPTTRVSIEFVPSLDDWKIAWDFVHFEGFLGTKMDMQFTWRGSDSILAAPLVIDLTRLAALELRRGHSGPMRHLAFFFKDPLDTTDHDLNAQWRRLVEGVRAGSA